MPDCVFCAIVTGFAPASVVHADEDVVAFMDVLPVNPRHTLVIPRVHASRLADLPEAAAGPLMAVGPARRSSTSTCTSSPATPGRPRRPWEGWAPPSIHGLGDRRAAIASESLQRVMRRSADPHRHPAA
jgi:hypothetical protein